MSRTAAVVLLAGLLAPPAASADDAAGIQWFATLQRGLAEARRTNRPILFVSAAPHCGGISGIW